MSVVEADLSSSSDFVFVLPLFSGFAPIDCFLLRGSEFGFLGDLIMANSFLYVESFDLSRERTGAMEQEKAYSRAEEKVRICKELYTRALANWKDAHRRLWEKPDALGREQLLRRAETERDFAEGQLDAAEVAFAHILETILFARKQDSNNCKWEKIGALKPSSTLSAQTSARQPMQHGHTSSMQSADRSYSQGPLDRFMVRRPKK